jgi:hypothetical protein
LPQPRSAPPSWQLSEIFAGTALALTALVLCLRVQAMPQLTGLCLAQLSGLAAYLLALFFLRMQGGLKWALGLRAALTIVGVIGSLYFTLSRAALEAVPWRADGWLAAADRFLGGGRAPSLFIERFATAGSVEFFSFAYGVFLPYLYVSVLLSCVGRPQEENRRFIDGLAFVYAVGYGLYLALPAQGPVAYLAGSYQNPLQGGFFYRQMLDGVARSGGNHGAFPSLHVAVSLYLCFFELRHNRLRGLMFFPLLLWITFATLLLRWHYLVDVIAGAALSVAALLIFSRRGGPSYNFTAREPAVRWPLNFDLGACFILAREAEIFLIGLAPALWVRLSLSPLGLKALRPRHFVLVALESLVLAVFIPGWMALLYGIFLAYCAWFYVFYEQRMGAFFRSAFD